MARELRRNKSTVVMNDRAGERLTEDVMEHGGDGGEAGGGGSEAGGNNEEGSRGSGTGVQRSGASGSGVRGRTVAAPPVPEPAPERARLPLPPADAV